MCVCVCVRERERERESARERVRDFHGVVLKETVLCLFVHSTFSRRKIDQPATVVVNQNLIVKIGNNVVENSKRYAQTSLSSAFPTISLRFTLSAFCGNLKLIQTSFFFFCVPSYISGVHPFWCDFCICDHF